MSIIATYQKEKFSQINLDDGNKILISYGTTDIRIFRVGFLHMFKEPIHILDSYFHIKLIQKIGYDMSKDIVKILADELVRATKISEVKEMCLRVESDKSFIEKI